MNHLKKVLYQLITNREEKKYQSAGFHLMCDKTTFQQKSRFSSERNKHKTNNKSSEDSFSLDVKTFSPKNLWKVNK